MLRQLQKFVERLLAEVYRVQWLVISTAKVTVVELDIKFIGTTTIHLISEHIRINHSLTLINLTQRNDI